MKAILLLIPLALIPMVPAEAASSQLSKQDASASRDANYWLSRDLQRLVFWQSRERATSAATPRS